MKQWAAAFLVLRFALAQTDDHGHDHGHDHGSGAFEWAGIFDTPNSNYLWTAQKTDGGYADPTLKMVALPTATVSQQALSDLEAQGETAMEATDSTCTTVQSGGTITPAANTCYILEFESSAWQSLFNIDASATAGIAFFTNHGPTEFEADAHYLKDSVGEDIEPVGELPEVTVTPAPETPYDWGLILAAVLVNVVAETSKEDAEGTVLNEEQKFRARARLLGAVLIGDFFHNLCDGFFIGAAFQVCGNAFGWSVATGTILHELPQEIADFVVLTGPGVSLSPLKALIANFASGLSVLIGAIIVSATPIDDSFIGLILAFGGGVYLHVGATDCLPKMYDPKLRFVERLAAMLAFVVGTVLIGLILIGHEHCFAPTSEGEGGHGHSHGHSH
ncbi:SLC39A12 [Symbiodinium necroappetens]|uniref:SLC39A12 protein n=1 Tax=Symbiodinium necroappetens TaxID=1628268 RepID=A0A812ZXP0_9DINO|nr:SLC39A12 [Symbiodinium necroappetens]